MRPKILVILGSTRQGRQGEKVAHWFMRQAARRADAEFELVDLRDWPLPFYDSSTPAAFGRYAPATQRWAEKVAGGDGFVFISPEYNHGYPAVLKNALDHLYREWERKPAAFVSYGAGSGGTRAVEQLRQVVVELKMAPVREQVGIPYVWAAFDDAGEPRDVRLNGAADALLDDVLWWAQALRAGPEREETAA